MAAAGPTGSSGYAAPRGGSRDGSSATNGASGKGSSEGSGGYTGGTVGTTVDRGGRRTGDPAGKIGNTSPTGDGIPTYSRPRDGGEPVGTAGPRGTTPPPPTGTTGTFLPRGYYRRGGLSAPLAA